MESHKDNQPKISQSQSKLQIFLKINFFAVLIFLGMLLVTAISIGIFAYSKLYNFSKSAGVSIPNLHQTLATGWEQSPTETDSYKNILILGVDTLETRGDPKPLTDSIILSSINLETGKITLLPLPRDLWSEDYQTKINALYTYGLERYPENPQKFSQEVISEMTNIEIHHTLVVSMEMVAEIIDLAGGVEVSVEQGFTDKEFPRTDVDVTTEADPENLYEVITFEAGLQKMDGQTALKYIRSRHGDNDQNTDNARSSRQQAVIQALVKKLTSKKTLLDTDLAGQLYKYYLDHLAADLTPTELIATGKKLLPNKDNIQLINTSLKIYPEDPSGTIEHPAQYLYDGQWVYSIRDQDKFKLNIKKQLN